MGRYCYFSNGFEYKFWFGVQESGFDFLLNAGIPLLENFTLTETDVCGLDGCGLEFSFKTNKDVLLGYICGKWSRMEFVVPDFTKFDTNEDGVGKLYDELFEKNEFNHSMGSPEAEEGANFCLACLIYLMGRDGDVVSGRYEV